MATVKGNVTPAFSFNQTASSGFQINQTLQAAITGMSAAFGNGTAADQVDLVGVGVLSLLASTMQSVDLTALKDIFGNAVALARVRAMAIMVQCNTNGATLTLAPDASNGWSQGPFGSGSFELLASSAANPNGSFFIQVCPNTTGFVVDSTHKVIDFTPSANAMTVYYIFAGASV